jgi:hypothetical protein
MILTNRLFTRREPEIDAQSLFIFCEGRKREYQYFMYFKGIDSRINIIVHQLKGDEDNSPTGLHKIATECLTKSEANPFPQYELLDGDQVWFVIDTDKWEDKVAKLRSECSIQNWNIAQSNPCFEVWLYYHLFDTPANFQWLEICEPWKEFLAENVEGGFNSNKHPIYIGQAIKNATANFAIMDNAPAIGSSEVFELAKVIYGFCKWKIENILNRI